MKRQFLNAALLFTLVPAAAQAQVNGSDAVKSTPATELPFTLTQVATFDRPTRIAFLPDGRMLVTEKPGKVFLVTQTGEKMPVANVPAVTFAGQNGLLGVFLSPKFATDRNVYLTYSEPDPATPAGTPANQQPSGLAMARGKLTTSPTTASLDGLEVLWRQMPRGLGGQVGAEIAFSPDGQYLFLSVGDRQRMTPAQDPDQAVGKILRLTLDGKPAPGNPGAGKTGATSVTLIAPPRNTEVAKTAPVVSTYTFPTPNLAPAEIWTSGHRTPYGLAFAPDGRLWEVEHGPRGGDELNLIEVGKNYGWPLVGEAPNYDGTPVPGPETRPDLQKPVIYWTPVIAPGNLAFYKGAMFPQWQGNGFISGIATMTLSRVVFDGKGAATPAERWNVGKRLRAVAVAPDGALWLAEDSATGGLYRVTPTAK